MEVKVLKNNAKFIYGLCGNNNFIIIDDGIKNVWICLREDQDAYKAKSSELFQNFNICESDGLSLYSNDGKIEKLLEDNFVSTENNKSVWVGWSYTKIHIKEVPFPHTETEIFHRKKDDILNDISQVITDLENYKFRK